MSCQTLLLLLGLLTAISALEPHLVKTLFSISSRDDTSEFAQPMIHTRSAVIGYNVRFNDTELSLRPQFISMDLEAQNVSLILEDTLQACGQGAIPYNDFKGHVHSRMHYHENTSTLVYYCAANNSLLILDEEDYSVKSALATGVTSLFNDTRLYAEGTSVVILGLGDISSEQVIFPQLIKIDLIQKKVVRQVTFNKNLASGEIVVAYASTNLLSFILTTTNQTSTIQVKIYAAVFVGSLYTLTPITTFSYLNPCPPGTTCATRMHDLQILGNYLVTNDNQTLLLYDIRGNLAYKYQGLLFQKLDLFNQMWIVPNFAMRHGNSSLYAGFVITEINIQLAQLTFQGQNVTSQVAVPKAGYYLLALGHQEANDLAFIFNNSFSIIDLGTLAEVYTAPATLDDHRFVMKYHIFTNSTYAFASNRDVTVYDLKSNKQIVDIYFYEDIYYEELSQVFYYFNYVNGSIMYFDIKTLSNGVIQTLPYYGDISHAGPTTNLSRPNLIFSYKISSDDAYMLFFSEKNGVFNFTRPPYDRNINLQSIIPDYDNLSFFLFGKYLSDGVINITKYQYDQTSKTLKFQSTYNVTNIPYGQEDPLIMDEDIIVFPSRETFTILHLSKGTTEQYPIPIKMAPVSKFKDNSGNNYIVFPPTDDEGPAYVFGPDKTISQLPGTGIYTYNAFGLGTCSYGVVDRDNALYVLNFYDVCSTDNRRSSITRISQ